jgi:hypothetical protein
VAGSWLVVVIRSSLSVSLCAASLHVQRNEAVTAGERRGRQPDRAVVP